MEDQMNIMVINLHHLIQMILISIIILIGGDGSNSYWYGPYDSGETCYTGHLWKGSGVYNITAKAKNKNDVESEPSFQEISISKNRYSINSLFHLILERFPLLKNLFY